MAVRAVKKTTSAKAKTVVEEPEVAATEAEQKAITDTVITMISEGALDFDLEGVFDALDDRVIKRSNEILAAAAKTPKVSVVESSKLPTTPIKKRVATVVPVEGKTYLLVKSFPKIGGALVKFERPRKDDNSRCVVELVDGVPGKPAGFKLVVPIAALEEAPVKTRKRATAVAPAGKTTKTVAVKATPKVVRRVVRKAAK